MKLRLALFLLSLSISLIISADRISKTSPDAWTAHGGWSPIAPAVGVNIHFTDPRPGEIKMIADAGLRFVRMDFKWDVTERARGRYDFSEYDRLLDALDAYKVHALLILDYGNPLYTQGKSVRTPEAREAFARWAIVAAKHFSGRGVVWELFNEPNIAMFWPPRPNVDEYVALALAVGRAFHANVPNEKLIGPATSGIDFDFLEACFKAGLLDHWSAVSVHPYRSGAPESAATDYDRLRKMIARYQGDRVEIPIISSEWGYSAVWRGMSEEKQAEMLAREMLTNLGNGIPISIWYDWRDDGVDPNEAEHHFGLVHNSASTNAATVFQEKQPYLAAKALAEMLSGFTFQRRLQVGSDIDYVLLFAKNDEVRIAAWTSGDAHGVTVPITPGSFQLSTFLGTESGPIFATSSGLQVKLSTTPVFLKR